MLISRFLLDLRYLEKYPNGKTLASFSLRNSNTTRINGVGYWNAVDEEAHPDEDSSARCSFDGGDPQAGGRHALYTNDDLQDQGRHSGLEIV